ncbi:hypothetical protein TYRP_012190 [Tyrophagus putrescentiae]|nr:hypothetical protein TYRP_012190 [Tyrophagus putrescentiae]
MNALSKLNSDQLNRSLQAIFSQMSANDRLAAHQVCPHWQHQVQEVNKAIGQWLIVSPGASSPIHQYLDRYFNMSTLANEPSVKLLSSGLENETDGQEDSSLLFFPPALRFTPGNSLSFTFEQLTEDTAQQIVAAFPATTELTFCILASHTTALGAKTTAYSRLVTMLTSERRGGRSWKRQLTSLRVISAGPRDLFPGEAFYRALNSLPALRSLDLSGVTLPKQEAHLPIFGRLEKLNLVLLSEECCQSFIGSLRQYAKAETVGNAEGCPSVLRVNLPNGWSHTLSLLRQLDKTLRRSIVRLNHLPLNVVQHPEVYRSLVDGTFPNLVSVALLAPAWQLPQLFASIAENLPRLCHLALTISFTGSHCNRQNEAVERVLASPLPIGLRPITSLQALDLDFSHLESHDQLCWLSLGRLFPHVKAASLGLYYCSKCSVMMKRIHSIRDLYSRDKVVKVTSCLRDLLSILVSTTGLPPQNVTHQQVKLFGSTEELLAGKVPTFPF